MSFSDDGSATATPQGGAHPPLVVHELGGESGITVRLERDGRMTVNGVQVPRSTEKVMLVARNADGSYTELPFDKEVVMTVRGASYVSVASRNGPVHLHGAVIVNSVHTHDGPVTVHDGSVGQATTRNGNITATGVDRTYITDRGAHA